MWAEDPTPLIPVLRDSPSLTTYVSRLLKRIGTHHCCVYSSGLCKRRPTTENTERLWYRCFEEVTVPNLPTTIRGFTWRIRLMPVKGLQAFFSRTRRVGGWGWRSRISFTRDHRDDAHKGVYDPQCHGTRDGGNNSCLRTFN